MFWLKLASSMPPTSDTMPARRPAGGDTGSVGGGAVGATGAVVAVGSGVAPQPTNASDRIKSPAMLVNSHFFMSPPLKVLFDVRQTDCVQ